MLDEIEQKICWGNNVRVFRDMFYFVNLRWYKMKNRGVLLLILLALTNLAYVSKASQNIAHIPSSTSQYNTSAASNIQLNNQFADVDRKSSTTSNSRKTRKAGTPTDWNN